MEGEQQGFVLEQGGIQGAISLNGQKFDIKRVLMQMLPTIMALITEFLTTGKLSGKGRDLKTVRALLAAILGELDTIIGDA